MNNKMWLTILLIVIAFMLIYVIGGFQAQEGADVNWGVLAGLVPLAFLGWLTYRNIKDRPEQFSWQNFNKTTWTLGILSLVLIASIAFVIMLLRQA